MLHFVTINHPCEAKERKRQSELRQHAIRSGIRNKHIGNAKRNDNFVGMEVDAKSGKARRKGRAREANKISRPIDADLLDPFDALYASGKHLREFRDRKLAVQDSKTGPGDENAEAFYASGMDAVFLGSLTNPSMFHALSLVLSLAKSTYSPCLDALQHRGNMLKDVRRRMADATLVPSISTLSAMLLLIGSEYRIEGSDAKSVAMHIRAIQNVLDMPKLANVAVSKTLRRALFWYDLHSCLFIGTPRLIAQEGYIEFNGSIRLSYLTNHSLPIGLLPAATAFPPSFSEVLQELNAFCHVIDSSPDRAQILLNDVPLDDFQYCIESRVIDLVASQQASMPKDPIYESCLYASFLCAYMLKTGIWEGCFIADFAAIRVLGCVSQAKHDSRWMQWKELLLWLLIVTGALTRKTSVKTKALMMVRVSFNTILSGMYEDWEKVKELLKRFIWSNTAMEQPVRLFWEELHG